MDECRLIAPCGMNCMLCQAYQGKGLSCQGCGQETERKSCQNCTIYKCVKKTRFCFECQNFPCLRLKRLDQRYRSKYHMSMLDNLHDIQKNGLAQFIAQQNKKYRCERCGRLKTVHQQQCLYCGTTQTSRHKGEKDI